MPKVSKPRPFPLNDSASLSVWFVVHTLRNAFLILTGVGDFKIDEEFLFLGVSVFIVPPGIIYM